MVDWTQEDDTWAEEAGPGDQEAKRSYKDVAPQPITLLCPLTFLPP